MVNIIIDESAIAAIAALLAPSVGWIITHLQKRTSNEQGNLAYAKMKDRGNRILKLAEKFPETAPLATEFRATAVYAELLWKTPKDNTDALEQAMCHGDKLLNDIFSIVEKYGPCIEEVCKDVAKKA